MIKYEGRQAVKEKDLSFVILTWNSEQYIKECLKSIIDKCRAESIRFEVFIIDNGSTDRTKNILEEYKEKLAAIYTIYLDKNYGTTYPRNMALKKAAGRYICILDSDTEILSGSLRETVQYLEDNVDTGIIAPKLILQSGEVQNSVKKFPTVLHKLEKIKSIIGIRASRNLDFYEGFPFSEKTEVDTAISACWIFRRSLLDAVGYLDEKIFYAPEDVEYCLRIWKMGKKIIYYPGLEILHNTQQLTHNNPFSRVALSHLGGLLYYFRKHSSWFSTKF